MTEIAMLGERSIWELPKTAFLCSDRFSAGSVLKSYAWASEMKRQGQCVISGFHSKLEKDVFELLLNGAQPVVWALARGLYDKPPAKYKQYIENGRLLIVSTFDKKIKLINSDLAAKRNQFVADNAVEIVFAHIQRGGKLDQLRKSIIADKMVRVLDSE